MTDRPPPWDAQPPAPPQQGWPTIPPQQGWQPPGGTWGAPGAGWTPPPTPQAPPPPPGWPLPPASEGSWWPRTYRRGRTRAALAQLCVGLTTGVLAATMVFLLNGMAFATRAWEGSATLSELDDFMATATTLDGVTLVCQLFAAIAVLAWVHRAVANTPALGGGTPRWTPAKSAAWWLVPFANLLLPWSIVRDLWRRMSPEGAGVRTGIVAAWWLCYIGGNLATSFASGLMESAGTASAVRSLFALTAATIGCTALSGVLLIWLIRRLEAWADARAAAVMGSVAGAAPQWPA